MRCASCDKNLNDFESTRKIVREDNSVHYPDLCNNCFKISGLSHNNVIERHDLLHEVDVDNSPDFDLEAFNEEHEYLEER
jgi:hypothetical protein